MNTIKPSSSQMPQNQSTQSWWDKLSHQQMQKPITSLSLLNAPSLNVSSSNVSSSNVSSSNVSSHQPITNTSISNSIVNTSNLFPTNVNSYTQNSSAPKIITPNVIHQPFTNNTAAPAYTNNTNNTSNIQPFMQTIRQLPVMPQNMVRSGCGCAGNAV